MTYAELHCSSAFSFLDGACAPEDLAARAARLRLPAVALADANGVYGAPRFYRACKEHGIKALVGSELTLPDGKRVTVLVENRGGYKNLCKLLTAGALGKEKGRASVDWDLIASHAAGLHCLTGGDEGLLGTDHAEEPLLKLKEVFDGRLHVELQRHLRREQERRNRALVELARRHGLPLLATNGVKYAARADKEVHDVMTSLRLGAPLDALGGRLAANSERHLKSPSEMLALFEDLPEAVEEAGRLAERLSFTLADLGYRFPDYPLPPGETPIGELRRLTWEAAKDRFRPLDLRTQAQLRKELAVVETLGLAGYFLIVHDIVRFCAREKIMVQGRGSAANSAVCYALGITAVDPVKMELLFERFLSEERGEWPDIDLDLPSGEQREKVIQHLYAKYGARGAAMTANVITYRPKSAIREAAKALGYSAEQQDRLSRLVGNLTPEEVRADPTALPKTVAEAGLDLEEPRVRKLLRVWLKLQNLPRHLGQHSGGMVLAGGRLDEVVPLEPAGMPGRVVIQWDKDDCADLGLIKVDLLGLGMLRVLEEAVALTGVDLAHLPQDDPEVYRMLNSADTVGVFQLESRAQMASLPRHAPSRFYDIVVQVAIIRPGPIVGGMVHPFFDRRRGLAPVEYPHPSLEPVLKRTLGVPLFQEQVLRMAMVAAGFSGGQAEELRRAIGFKRSAERMDEIEQKLRQGLRRNGCSPAQEDRIVTLITSFALYGFPESHAASFALIAYASAYLKARHPAAFYAALLNAWPMGFYHPSTIVKDAQRRGVAVLPVDANASKVRCTRAGDKALRLGLRFVHGLTAAAAARLEAAAPFASVEDAARRAELSEEELAVLAQAGAFAAFGLTRREALWQAAKAARPDGPLFEGAAPDAPSPLPEMTAPEVTDADYETTRLTVGPHRVAHLRAALTDFGVTSAAGLAGLPHGSPVRMAGSVVVRQRPGTAKGFIFVTLEDETGLAQAIISPALFARQRGVLLSNPGLIIEGILQKQEGTLSVKAARLWPLAAAAAAPSHDFK
jgi:error-prone DNA polymerase